MISVKDLQKIEKNKQNLKKEIYKKIYYQFSNKIKRNAELSQKHTYLTIPPFLVGYPTYNMEQAALYIKRQFERSGFSVSIFDKVNLLVEWYIPNKKQKEKDMEKPTDDESFDMPSLMNIKKAARKYK